MPQSNEHDRGDNQTQGCGLLLCELCAVTLTSEHEGNIPRFLREVGPERSRQRPLGLRADVELLRPGGPLLRLMQRNSQGAA